MLSGFKLKMLRLHKNLTQQYISDCLEISENYISMMENNQRAVTEELYPKWIDALNGVLKPKPKEDSKKKSIKKV